MEVILRESLIMCKVVFYWLIMNLIIQWQKAFQIVLGKFVYFLQTDISKWQWTVATFVKFLKSFLTSRHHYNVKYYVDRLSRGVGGLILCLNGINKCFLWSFACSDHSDFFHTCSTDHTQLSVNIHIYIQCMTHSFTTADHLLQNSSISGPFIERRLYM